MDTTITKLETATRIFGIARICHDANRAYCLSIGDTSQPTWESAPDWQRTSAVNGVKAHLESLAAGIEPDPAWSHKLWLKEKNATGWIYGPEENPAKKEHPCMVPFEDLPREQQLKDRLFAAIVKVLA